MKKLLMTVVVLGCAAAVTAQTVTSANTVGYTKVTASAGQLSLVALNFTPSSPLVNDLIGDQLPAGSTLHIWDKSAGNYSSVTYTTSRAGTSWPATAEVNLGDSFWIEVALGGGTLEVVLAGEVLGSDVDTTIGGPIDMTGYYYPVSTTWGSTDLSDVLPENAVLHLWTGSNYVSHVKTTSRAGTSFSPEALAEVIDPAQGFWVEAPATAWTEEVPY